MTKESWATSVRREAPYATVVPHGVVVNCTGCEAVLDIKGSNRPASAMIRKTVNMAGWLIRNGKAKCAACSGPRKPAVPINEDQPPVNIPEKIVMPAPTPVAAVEVPLPSEKQTPDARKIHRAVLGWLEEAYAEESKTYRKGFSDQSIAAETGASVSYVVKCREDYFGPLGMPPEIDALRGEIAASDRAVADVEKKFRDKMDAVRAEFFAALSSCNDHRKKLEARLNSLCKEQGWA